MARREDVETSIWSDHDFLDLSAPARHLYIWSFTNPRCNMAGIYQVTKKAILMETGLKPVALDRIIPELAGARFVFYDDRVMFVRSRIKHLRSRSGTIARAIRADLERLVPHPFLRDWWEENKHHSWILEELNPELVAFLDGSSEGYAGPIDGSPGKGMGFIAAVFNYWKDRCNHPQAKLTNERATKIRARRNEGYTEEDIRKGIDGAAKAAYVDERGKRFDDIELICRNGSKLESFMERADAGVVSLPRHPALRRMDSWRDPEDAA